MLDLTLLKYLNTLLKVCLVRGLSTYNEVGTLLKDLQQPVKTTLLRDLTDSQVRMSPH